MKPWTWVLLFLLLTALTPPPAHAAVNGTPVWTNRFTGSGTGSDYAQALAVGKNGNVFVTGLSDGYYVTVSYSGTGVPLWTNRYRGPGNSIANSASAIVLDIDGNVFVTGYSESANHDLNYATVAYSGTGMPLWTNRYDAPGMGTDQATAIAADANGNVFVTGHSGNGIANDFVTVAYSGAGVPLWTNRYNGPGNNLDQARAIAVDGSGNVFVMGTSFANGSLYDYATIAYSGAGVPLWTNSYNGPANGNDGASAIAVDRSGNVFVTGSSLGSGSTNDFATVAYSGAGVPLWTNRYNGPGNGDDHANAIAVDGQGNVFVTGQSAGSDSDLDYATVAYSGAGVPLWTNRYNGPENSADSANGLALDGRGNVFVTGYSCATGNVNPDYVTVAYSRMGVPLWTNRYNGPANTNDYPTAIAVDENGNVFVTGFSGGSGSGSDYATVKYAAMLTLTQTAADNGQFQFQFNADSNLTYAVEFSDALSSSNWMTLTNIAALPAATNLVITNAITNDARFFRVRTP